MIPHNENEKLIILNLVSKALKDGTIVALHMPWTVSLHLDIAMLPFMIRSIHGHFLEQEGIIALTEITLHTKSYQTNRLGKLKEALPKVYCLKPGEAAVIHSGCQASIQLDGNHVASRPDLKLKQDSSRKCSAWKDFRFKPFFQAN